MMRIVIYCYGLISCYSSDRSMLHRYLLRVQRLCSALAFIRVITRNHMVSH